MNRKTSLVTGASSGIGKEIARIHAERGGDIVLVARREKALKEVAEELQQSYDITAHVIPADLSSIKSTRELCDELHERGITIDVLVNNAGFGQRCEFRNSDIERQLTMIDLNIKSLMILTRYVLPGMIERGRGWILNVGSTAGMVPGPYQATYHASKAFVNSFSQAIAEEVRGTGVSVTLLAPGAVNTEFLEVADLENAKGVQKNAASPEDVARLGYEAMEKEKLVVINDLKLRFLLNWLKPFLPRRTILKMAREFAEQI